MNTPRMTPEHLAALNRVNDDSQTPWGDVALMREVRENVQAQFEGRLVLVDRKDATELRDALNEFGSLLYGWHSDGTSWSDWDESVRQRLLRINTDFRWLASPLTDTVEDTK